MNDRDPADRTEFGDINLAAHILEASPDVPEPWYLGFDGNLHVTHVLDRRVTVQTRPDMTSDEVRAAIKAAIQEGEHALFDTFAFVPVPDPDREGRDFYLVGDFDDAYLWDASGFDSLRLELNESMTPDQIEAVLLDAVRTLAEEADEAWFRFVTLDELTLPDGFTLKGWNDPIHIEHHSGAA